MSGKPFRLTPEQIALSAERKAKKQTNSSTASPTGTIVNRAWIQSPEDANDNRQEQQIKVLTWNVCLLPQCYITQTNQERKATRSMPYS